RSAGQQLRLQHLVAVIDIVGDLDPGLRLELRNCIGRDVIRPVINIEPRFFADDGRRSEHRGQKPALEPPRPHEAGIEQPSPALSTPARAPAGSKREARVPAPGHPRIISNATFLRPTLRFNGITRMWRRGGDMLSNIN